MKIELLGIKLFISFPFAAAITVALTLDKTGSTALCLICAILHECGHIAAMKYFGGGLVDISLSPLDFRIKDCYSNNRAYFQDVIISLCGPLVNFILWGICINFEFLYPFAYSNIAIGLFNIIPVESLDGGRIVSSLSKRFLSPKGAQRLCNILSMLFIIPIASLGFYVLISTGYNWSLLLIAGYLLTLMFFKKG